MIEFENGGVRLTTVDAGMREQIFEYEHRVAFSVPLGIRADVGDVLFAIVSIPRALARPAVTLTPERRRDIELGERQDLAATRARAHIISCL
jgi:hypothetical protein